MIPRAYQTRTEQDCLAAWDSGKRAVCIVAPTGAGKTEMAGMLQAHAKRPASLVHTLTLKDQTKRRLPRSWVTTVQGLLPDGPAADARRAKAARADMAFLDECHHIVSEEWLKARNALTGARVFGCTATPERADGTPLGDVFDHLVVSASYSELISNGWLVPCDVDKPHISRKDQKKLKVRPDGVHAYLSQAKREDGGWRPGIYFDSTIALCEEATTRFNEAGVRAALVCMDTDTDERRRLFDMYSLGYLDMLCSPQALAEGFDAPRAEVCILRRSAGGLGFYLQTAGRVLRAYSDEQVRNMLKLAERMGIEPHASAFHTKDRALLIDITRASELHKLPTDDRKYSLEGRAITLAEDEIPEEELNEESDFAGREGPEAIEARYERVRDQLRDQLRELQAIATERGYKPSTVFDLFRQQTGIVLPMPMRNRFKTKCFVCTHTIEKGSEMLWLPLQWEPSRAFHADCYFSSLTGEQLEPLKHAAAQ